MKRLLVALALLCAAPAYAQTQFPVAKDLWGASSERVEAWLMKAPGFRRVTSNASGNVYLVSYDRIDNGNEALVYSFRDDALVEVSRMVLAEDEKKSGPLSNWKSVGPNEWLIADENMWVRRVYDGQFVRDTIRRIHE